MFQTKLSIITILLALALILLVSACQGAQAAQVNEVTFTAHDNSFSGPETIPAGWIRLRLINEGPDLYHIQLVKLSGDKTGEALIASLHENPMMPAWAKQYGGPNPPIPGQSSEAVVKLEPGNYVIIDWVPDQTGTPHFAHGMVKALTVTPSKGGEGVEPQADVSLDMLDFSYSLSKPLTTGQHTLQVNNKGQQPHEVFLARLAPGKGVDEFLASLAPGSPAEAIDWQALGGISVIEPGTHSYFSVDLEPGKYVVICFAPDHGSGAPHFMNGMVQEIIVQ
jgi:hypothetical protein